MCSWESYSLQISGINHDQGEEEALHPLSCNGALARATHHEEGGEGPGLDHLHLHLLRMV